MKFRVGVALLALLALAFRVRPVSDLGPDDTLPYPYVMASASDGRDLLVLVDGGEQSVRRVYAQRVSHDGVVERAFHLGEAEDAAVVWSEGSYLVALGMRDGLQLARVSAEGALLGAPAPIDRRWCGNIRLAARPGRTLLTAACEQGLSAFLLDEHDRLTRAPVRLSAFGTSGYQTAATASGFALAEFTRRGATLQRLDVDGNAAGEPLVIDAGVVAPGKIAARGDEIALAYPAGDELDRVMFAVVGAANELLTAPTRIREPLAGQRVDYVVAGMAWTGEHVTVAVNWLGTNERAELLYVARDGSARGSAPLAGAPFEAFASTLHATASGDAFVTWLQHESAARHWLAGVVRRQEIARYPLGRALAAQLTPAIASRRGEYLVAWCESRGGDRFEIRASRLDRNGRYLDGRGILVGLGDAGGPFGLAAASDGTNWLVVWENGAARIAPDGRLLDERPLDVGFGRNYAVAAGAGRFMLAFERNGSIFARELSAGGVPGPERQLVTFGLRRFARPAVVFRGNEFLVAFTIGESRFFEEQQIGVQRVDLTGAPIGTPYALTFAIPSSRSPVGPRLAWNGRETLVAATASAILGRNDVERPLYLHDRVPFASGCAIDVAADGRDFVMALDTTLDTALEADRGRMVTLRLSPSGVVLSGVNRILGHHTRPALTADAGSAPMLAMVERDPLFDAVPRVAVAFLSEVGEAPQPRPLVVQSTRAGDFLDVTWTPLSDVTTFGIAVEVQEPDGMWRLVGVAPAGAGRARMSLHGFEPVAVRAQAWSGPGLLR